MNLSWTPVITANVTSQVASKRRKSVGGAFDTTGFTPPNNMSTAVNSAVTSVIDNVVYEFKIENICNTGGPTINNNGIREQIKFACILPQISSSSSSTINVNVPLLNTDIQKVSYFLYKQSDNSVAGTQVVIRSADNSNYTFSGLTGATGYYLRITLSATINGVEVNSSSPSYLNSTCGGNITGYQIATSAVVVTCNPYINSTGSPIIGVNYTDCNSTVRSGVTVNPGEQICVVSGTLANGGGLTLLPPDEFCSSEGGFGSLEINASTGGGGTIDSITSNSWFITPLAPFGFPVGVSDPINTTHTGIISTINVNCTVSVNSRVEVYKNGTLHACDGQIGVGAQVYSLAVFISSTDTVLIRLVVGDLCP